MPLKKILLGSKAQTPINQFKFLYLAEVGFEPTTFGYKSSALPSELSSPMMGPIPFNQFSSISFG